MWSPASDSAERQVVVRPSCRGDDCVCVCEILSQQQPCTTPLDSGRTGLSILRSRRHSVVVITLDSESSNPSSNLGGACFVLLLSTHFHISG
eukprot:jgi/Chrzof1/7913/Cz02g41030.t1